MVPTLLQKQNSFPFMDGTSATQSANFMEVGLFFHAYTKLTLFLHGFFHRVGLVAPVAGSNIL
jgi:hypothetical protein